MFPLVPVWCYGFPFTTLCQTVPREVILSCLCSPHWPRRMLGTFIKEFHRLQCDVGRAQDGREICQRSCRACRSRRGEKKLLSGGGTNSNPISLRRRRYHPWKQGGHATAIHSCRPSCRGYNRLCCKGAGRARLFVLAGTRCREHALWTSYSITSVHSLSAD